MVESNDPQIWLILAEKEFAYASSDLTTPGNDFFAPTCFHFHQAAEKSLKAYILSRSGQFRKVHNLIELLSLCSKYDPSFLQLNEKAAFLNPFYTDTRYPVHWPIDFTKEDAQRAKLVSGKILNFVKEKISKVK